MQTDNYLTDDQDIPTGCSLHPCYLSVIPMCKEAIPQPKEMDNERGSLPSALGIITKVTLK